MLGSEMKQGACRERHNPPQHGVVSFEEGPEGQEEFYRKRGEGMENKRLSTLSFLLLISIY